MDIRKIKKLIELLEQSDLVEIEVKEKDNSVRISRASKSNTQAVANSALNANTANNTVISETKEQKNSLTTINSPMVGTFYSASSPNSRPFVELGEKVSKGDVICIIEAMKIMNEIEADKSGTITDILCKDGDAVEFEQELMVIE